MPRIKDVCSQLKKQGRKAFVAYVPFGFPEISYTESILLALQDAGVSIIELGLPFSDPLADGPVIQKATALSLRRGANQNKLFSLLLKMKPRLKVPLVLMTYANPLFQFGMNKFFKRMKEVNASGVIVVDLPLEESEAYLKAAGKFGLAPVFLITPTTRAPRAKKIAELSEGFVYYVSVSGITGPKELAFSPLKAHLRGLRKITSLPIYIGFGVHTHRQVKELGRFSDGVIVGSGIVQFIEKHYLRKDFSASLKKYIRSLKGSAS